MSGAIVLLFIGLLIGKELLAAYRGPSGRKSSRLHWFDLVLFGLFIAFLAAIASRVIEVIF